MKLYVSEILLNANNMDSIKSDYYKYYAKDELTDFTEIQEYLNNLNNKLYGLFIEGMLFAHVMVKYELADSLDQRVVTIGHVFLKTDKLNTPKFYDILFSYIFGQDIENDQFSEYIINCEEDEDLYEFLSKRGYTCNEQDFKKRVREKNDKWNIDSK